jgi:ubiquinone/menaquinone biosynthesis C-methylase UbiE
VSGERREEIVAGFSRQAAAFARSPLHRDPERLRRLIDWADPQSGEAALDIACGPGLVAGAIAGRGAFAVGIDLTGAMLREAAIDARAAGTVLPLVRGAAERLPFGDRTFDLVICRNAFHHLPDPARVMGEAARVLRAGGRMVLEDMQAPERLVDRDAFEVIERLRDATHARTLPRSRFLGLLIAAGLRPAGEQTIRMTIDFDEWIDRAFTEPAARARARWLLESDPGGALSGRRVWREGDRLKFERPSLLLRGVRS